MAIDPNFEMQWQGTNRIPQVWAMVTLPNGDLVAGGMFTHAGGVAAPSIARWNGTSWARLGGASTSSGNTLNGWVYSLAVLPNGNVVAGGSFAFSDLSGTATYNDIGVWDGTSWAPLGTGIAADSRISELAVLPNGDVVAGGYFTTIDGVAANGLARWNGTNWAPMGPGLACGALTVLSNGNLLAARWFPGGGSSTIYTWDGATWSSPASGVNGPIYSLTPLPNGDVVVGGQFTAAGGAPASSVALWNGATWQALGSGVAASAGNQAVHALAVLPEGSLVAGGTFESAGGVPVNNIATWNGNAWAPMGDGLLPNAWDYDPYVCALHVVPNGDLMAGVRSGSHDGIARWACPARSAPFGMGCYNHARSYLEFFAIGQFDLGVAAPSTRSILMTPSNGGYTVSVGSNGWHVPSTALGLGDDDFAVLQLPSAFTFPTGSTSALTICSNGFITLNGNSTNVDFLPLTSSLLAGEPRLCPAWCDLVPDAAHDVYAEVDAVNSTAYITWDGVPTFNWPIGSFRMQVAIDLNTMAVEFRYRDCDNPGTEVLTGWSPGNAAVDPGNRDLSTVVTFQTSAIDSAGLTHGTANQPFLGSQVVIDTAHVPPTSLFGATLLGFSGYSPGVDLTALGMPGCFQYASADTFSVFLPSAGVGSFSFQIPAWNILRGVHLFSQGVAFVPGVNPLGVLSSNGADLQIGTL